MRRISSDRLRALRNLDVERVVLRAGLSIEARGRRRRFICPLCRGCQTTLASRRNLLRCFRCQKSFNPIDFVIAAGGYTFLEAVAYLESMDQNS